MKNQANSIDVHLGARCQRRRNELGMTVADVARGIDTDVDQFVQMESGAIRIGPDKLMRLSRLLDVDVEYFFKGLHGIDAQSDNDSDLEAFLVLNESKALMQAFVQIASPSDRQQVIALAASLTGQRRTGEMGG